MKNYIKIFCKKIREETQIDELIKVENFKIDSRHTGYLYAYLTNKGIHIDVSVSTGTPCYKDFINYSDIYCSHTLHEYFYKSVITDKDITLEWCVEDLLNKTIQQFDVLEPIQKERLKNNEDSIL